ncbi:unnamed protein product [Penicillium egyptiacum]|uniref:Pisatin demethylase n=1 Tax=Penicillium egyptiacum TaxID=1303716 RepID=A0A9W4KRF0_9EURO|nr:unnamed protein product [Penicillium egyptiacum]
MAIALLICASCVPLYFVAQALLSPLRGIPGPFWARFTRLWKLLEIYRGRFEKTSIALHKKYGKRMSACSHKQSAETTISGPIVRIAPNEYSIDDPGAVKEIYGLGSQFIKSPWYTASSSPDPNAVKDLFSDRDVRTHASNRRKVASLYSMSNLVQMEPFVNDCTKLLEAKFTKFAEQGRPVDMGHWLQCYAFDVIGHITVCPSLLSQGRPEYLMPLQLGERFGFLDNGEDIGSIIAAVNDYVSYAAHVGVYSELHGKINELQSRFRQKGSGMANMVAFTRKQLQQRISDSIEKSLDRGDFISKLLSLHKEDPKGISEGDIFTTCMTNIGAGSDTTSISLGSIVYYLCRHQNAMHALREEIATMEAKGEISNPVTFAESQRMPYLQAVIKEALRMHPATGLPLGRVVPPGGKVIAGCQLPEGTVVGINSWVAHANTAVFGDDASNFRPERWLDGKEKTASLDRYFFSFGMGSRTCIGKHISLLEMSKLVPQLIRNFDISLENSHQTWRTTNRWFVKQSQYPCKLERRAN